MGKIFKGQTKLHIELRMDIDITGATSTKIKFLKPDNTSGEFDATIKDATNGILEYDIDPVGSELDQVGNWYIWAYVVLSDGSKIPGESSIMQIFTEGSV